MQEGDRVRHKKYGVGTVRRLYPKTHAARVEYDSGHVTVNSQSRVEVLTAGQRPAETSRPRERPAPTRRRVAGTSNVDYDLLERARARLTEEFPDADRVVSLLYQNRAYCEVWADGAAKIYFYDE